MATIDQQFFELMCRAPAVPDWFMSEHPCPPGFTRIRVEPDEREKQRLIEWPAAYARMVLEAARRKPDNQFSDKDLKGFM